MNVTKNPEKRIGKLFKLTIAVLAASFIADTFIVQLFKNGLISWENLTVLFAPPVEEAIKGGVASLFGVVYLAFFIKGKDLKFEPITGAVLAGIFSGVFFALVESLMQRESLLALGTGLYTHPIWAVGVSIGCWLSILYGDRTFLIGAYPVAVAGHMSLNYYIQHPSGLTRVVSFLLIMAIIIMTAWRYLSLRFNSDLCEGKELILSL